MTIALHKDESLLEVSEFIRGHGGRIHSSSVTRSGGVVNAQLDFSLVPPVARLPSVSWIEPMGRLEPGNDNVRWIIQSGDPGPPPLTPIHDRGLAGQSQTVTVCDTGLDLNHEAFSHPGLPFTYGVLNPGHRKVYLYYKVTEGGVDYGDYVAGPMAPTFPGPWAETPR